MTADFVIRILQGRTDHGRFRAAVRRFLQRLIDVPVDRDLLMAQPAEHSLGLSGFVKPHQRREKVGPHALGSGLGRKFTALETFPQVLDSNRTISFFGVFVHGEPDNAGHHQNENGTINQGHRETVLASATWWWAD